MPGSPASSASSSESAPRRRGRPSGARAGDAGTRDRILAEARTEFSERGYDKTSIRSIAKAAGVDSALVHHYFGTKDQVFAAAIEVSFAPALRAPLAVATGDPAGTGERMARFIFGIWESPATREPLLAILRSAVSNDAAAAVLRELVTRRLLMPVAEGLHVPDPQLRAQLAAAQLIGIAMLRYVIKAEPVASADIDEVIAMVAPTLQGYLAG
jgi:AcrR family transcriptional regulator